MREGEDVHPRDGLLAMGWCGGAGRRCRSRGVVEGKEEVCVRRGRERSLWGGPEVKRRAAVGGETGCV